MPQLLVRQSSLHVIQLLLHHGLAHLTSHLSRLVAGRAQKVAVRNSRHRRWSWTLVAGSDAASRWRPFHSVRRRHRKQILTTAVVSDRTLTRDIAQRFGARVAGS